MRPTTASGTYSGTWPTATGTEVALNPAELAAAQLTPTSSPRRTRPEPAGPAWLQIGTEGGFLPAPVVIPNQVTTWIIDPTRFDVGNVDKHALLVAPAERADVLVDFSSCGEDADPLQRRSGGVPGAGRYLRLLHWRTGPDRRGRSTFHTARLRPQHPDHHAGHGRTGTGGTATRDVSTRPAAALQAAFAHHADGSGVFESSQDPIIVGQAAYNSAYGTTFRTSAPRNGVVRRIRRLLDGFNTLVDARNGRGQHRDHPVPAQGHARRDELGRLR